MYITSIALDGFKSYGHRTEITGFDREFNAITGLNGSGKSNILDSICFVLGITNLSHVRANNLHELIFKNGQGNIKKATVSITFDNSNKSQSPIGYENCSEITVTRQITVEMKNKYMINGITKPNKKVQELFCSVQLNINNPNFVIMQGKITKVLSMKPIDILGMIEEAAGTYMYEQKKQAAQKTIIKKTAKLEELQNILNEDLTPKLMKAKKERAQYFEYKQVEADLENFTQLYQGWEVIHTRNRAKLAAAKVEKGVEKLQGFEDSINENKQKIKEIEAEIKALTEKANQEGSEKLKQLEKELKEATTVQVKSNSNLKSIADNIKIEETKRAQLEKNKLDDEKTLAKKQKEVDKMKDMFENLKENDRRDKEALETSEKRFAALNTGKDLNDAGEAVTLQEQLMQANEQTSKAQYEIKQAEFKLSQAKKQLAEKSSRQRSDAGEVKQKQEAYNNAIREVEQYSAQIKGLNIDECRLSELKQKRVSLGGEVNELKERVDRFTAQRPYTVFKYSDPEPNFDRRQVKGVVCRLFQVKDEKFCDAVGTVAGGTLYNVVTDTNVVTQKLLEHGQLTQRTTFIPMNKIRANPIPDHTIKLAEDLVGKENVCTALSLITYNNSLTTAMEYIFGNTFVCKDINIARQIAFHDRIKRRCVTIGGDVVDPAGTLSGGALKKDGSVLKQIADIRSYEEALQAKDGELQRVIEQLAQIGGQEQRLMQLKDKLNMAERSAGMLKENLQATSQYRQREELAKLEQEVAECEEKIATNRSCEKEYCEKVELIKVRIKNSNVNELIREVAGEVKKLKAKVEASRDKWQAKETEYDQFILEIEGIQNSIVNTQAEIDGINEAIEAYRKQMEDASGNSTSVNDRVTEVQGRVNAEKALVSEKLKDVKLKSQQQANLESEISDMQVALQEYKHTQKKLLDELKVFESKEKDLLRRVDANHVKNAAKLGEEEGRALESKIREARDIKNRLARTVNNKAQSLFEQQEKEYNDLKKKLRIVETDKRIILKSIHRLDEKKLHILGNAHEQISKDFGSIFGTLLPGAESKLSAALGQSILKGLEIRVALGGVWKANLTELSGGQRSLAALSLILAMLLYKPAPLYILDEVDAALDLSHTQNIGKMLKSHFKKSQFIIVSLKDGMFNNANVLFRTQFVDGVSNISRTANQN